MIAVAAGELATRWGLAQVPALVSDRLTCSSGCLPPAGLRRQFSRAVAVVVRVQRYAWRYELIDAVQDLGVQRDVHRRELRLELLHGPRADDRRGDAGVVDRPCQCELDHRHS